MRARGRLARSSPLARPRRTPIRNDPPPENTAIAVPSNIVRAREFVSPTAQEFASLDSGETRQPTGARVAGAPEHVGQ